MKADLPALLERLRPRARHAVMDLVAQAGIDVSGWALKRDPKNPERTVPVAEPRANPNYCYEWAFGDEAQGYVLCVWHASLKPVELTAGPAIAYGENIRELALSLDRIAIDRTRDTAERNRARDQARRARAFDVVLQRAFRKHVPVRLIINEGDRRPLEELGKSKSTVKLRQLDEAKWFVHAYDDQGLPLLVRGVPLASSGAQSGLASTAAEPSQTTEPPVIHEAEAKPPPPPPAYVDQFSALAPAAAREATVTVRERSAAVRERVLRRAAGRCEWCGRPGFRTLAGAVYLETHHVVPLAEDGPDHESNVLALCPEDHRRAHHAHDRDDMTKALLAKLAALLMPTAAR
jgi:5-methylcytosine-specific restriction protein A